MKNSRKISVIVPAYNEEKKIVGVINSLFNSNSFDQIICVNDGSTDNTLQLLKKFKKISLINLKKNHGKGYAIGKGIEKAHGEIIVFIDADKSGFNNKLIQQLIQPLLNKKYDGVIGYLTHIEADKLFRPLSGERAYWKKDLLPHLKEIKTKGYGLELFLNYLYRNKKIKLFPLKGIKHALKYEKQSYETVAKLFLAESFDILSEIIKQKNPFSYIVKSYIYSFYLKKPGKNNNQLNRLTNYIKKNLINKL